jgi:hypothetical protein
LSIEIDSASDFRLHTSDNRRKSKAEREKLKGESLKLKLEKQNQEPRAKNKDCLLLIEIFCFFQTSYFIPQITDN